MDTLAEAFRDNEVAVAAMFCHMVGDPGVIPDPALAAFQRNILNGVGFDVDWLKDKVYTNAAICQGIRETLHFFKEFDKQRVQLGHDLGLLDKDIDAGGVGQGVLEKQAEVEVIGRVGEMLMDDSETVA